MNSREAAVIVDAAIRRRAEADGVDYPTAVERLAADRPELFLAYQQVSRAESNPMYRSVEDAEYLQAQEAKIEAKIEAARKALDDAIRNHMEQEAKAGRSKLYTNAFDWVRLNNSDLVKAYAEAVSQSQRKE